MDILHSITKKDAVTRHHLLVLTGQTGWGRCHCENKEVSECNDRLVFVGLLQRRSLNSALIRQESAVLPGSGITGVWEGGAPAVQRLTERLFIFLHLCLVFTVKKATLRPKRLFYRTPSLPSRVQ